jgi:hypothetical protein
MDIGDFVMMRRTLLGIRARAEHARRDPSPSTAPARDPGVLPARAGIATG